MSNLATSAMHFKLDRSAYYDGVGSMDVWVHGNHGMMCKYEGGSSIAPSSAYIKNISAYRKDGRVYIYIISPDYNDSWRILDYGTRGDARFDCKVVEDLPTNAELIYDLSSKKGLVGDSYLNGDKYVTNSDLAQFLSIEQYMKNFYVEKGTKTIQLLAGIYLVSWSQYGAWSEKGTAIVYNSTYQSSDSKYIHILYQKESSVTLSQSIDGKLTITNNIAAGIAFSILQIGGPKFHNDSI